ncbi:hypothetical protein TNCV_2243041 [Trichonephila clavipes]|nr:hypothetical protein TNCV_2243041 [Trichonephila clavipes]
MSNCQSLKEVVSLNCVVSLVQRHCSRLFSSVYSILVCLENKKFVLHPTGRVFLASPHPSDSCRPRASAVREDRLIVRSAVKAFDSSLSTIRRTSRTRVSTMTFHRRMIEQILRSYRPLRQLPFTPARHRARLQ